VVAVVVAAGTQSFIDPSSPLLRLASGHRYLTQPLLAAVLPSGAWEALDHLLVGLDYVLVALLMLLLLGWGARPTGFDSQAFRRGLPASLLVLLAGLALWSPLAMTVERDSGWWAWDLETALAAATGWLRGFGEEALFRGVLQSCLVVGLHRWLGRRRPGTAVALGIALAAAWGTAYRLPFIRAEGLEGWALAHLLVHRELLMGLVLGAIYARTGDLVLTGGLRGAFSVMARLRITGWPVTVSGDLLLATALVLVAVFLKYGLLRPHGPDDAVRRSGR
jgi:membrane protease YdiL (CAAX protease family)